MWCFSVFRMFLFEMILFLFHGCISSFILTLNKNFLCCLFSPSCFISFVCCSGSIVNFRDFPQISEIFGICSSLRFRTQKADWRLWAIWVGHFNVELYCMVRQVGHSRQPLTWSICKFFFLGCWGLPIHNLQGYGC